MANVNKNYLSIRDGLDAASKKYDHTDIPFCSELFTRPAYSSSSRSVMFGSHIKAHMTLLNPDFPNCFTNYESIFGELSTSYFKTEYEYEILAKIPRYSWCPNHLYTLIVYNKTNDKYEIIEKKGIEDLTENFCYKYKTEVIDSYNEGDTIEKGTILWRSTSYDEDMNFGYGANVLIEYGSNTNTTEDALVVTESCCQKFASMESEIRTITVNDNDIMGNLYGNKSEYKPLPDIGEDTSGNIVCFKRRKFNNQALYDFKDNSLRKINFSSDVVYYSSGGTSIVEDITIYSNKEYDEIPDIPPNTQIKKYLSEQTRYWTSIVEITKDLITKYKEKVSADINYAFKRGSMILSPEYKWKMEDQIFNNFIINVTIKRVKTLSKGSKLTGLYGNKGVVSKIIPDKQAKYHIMPDGTKRYVDIQCNRLGVINRTNPAQLYEQDINYAGDRFAEKIKFECKSLEEKEKLFFGFYKIMNRIQGEKLNEYYYNLPSDTRKELFFDNVYKEGFYVHVPPFWQIDDIDLFEKLRMLYSAYPWLANRKPVYINRFGRQIQTLRTPILGREYFMKLKQNSKKAFSACALSAINEQNLPMKSKRAKDGLELFPKATIRFGIQESTNFIIGVDPEVLAKMSKYYRSCPAARRLLAKQSISVNKLKKLPDIDENVMNVNIEILNAYLKCKGFKIRFSDQELGIVHDFGNERIFDLEEQGILYIGTEYDIMRSKIERKVRKFYKENRYYVGTKEEYDELINEEIDRCIELLFNTDPRELEKFTNK